MIIRKVAPILLSSLLVAGCGSKAYFINSSSQEYLKASMIQPLKIPPGLSSDQFRNDYPVPYHYYPNKDKEVSITPPGLE
ncbi:MAG: hypothetical protein H0W64_01055 [Gammaproteobacteria bacterium]|nr:hypothetical protein [Gammaproteobacteria bacterium]